MTASYFRGWEIVLASICKCPFLSRKYYFYNFRSNPWTKLCGTRNILNDHVVATLGPLATIKLGYGVHEGFQISTWMELTIMCKLWATADITLYKCQLRLNEFVWYFPPQFRWTWYWITICKFLEWYINTMFCLAVSVSIKKHKASIIIWDSSPNSYFQ